MMRRRRRRPSDDRPLALSILTTATILAIGTAAGGIALIPYLQGHGELTLENFQRISALALLFITPGFRFLLVCDRLGGTGIHDDRQ